MRFDTPIYLQSIVSGAYDPATGDYGADTVKEVKMYASVTDSGADTLNLVYGGIKQGSKTIRLQGHLNAPFDCIRIGRKVYRIDMSRQLRTKQTLVVSEVQ